MTLEETLADYDGRYSEEHRMVGAKYKGPGYHTKVADGTWAHQVREALDYAVALLATDDAGRHERAAGVVAKVLTLQDTCPASESYGIWPYLLEEPLDEMDRPDWNTAGFCGDRLVQILVNHESKLSTSLAADVRESLRHAAASIVRRNVGPGYTNIAIAGASVTLVAGEVLPDPKLVEYGRERLRRFVEHTRHHGGFNEYNSPGYGVFALRLCEWIVYFVHDPIAREHALDIHRLGWLAVADHFHVGTHQWAGPHSRNYSDRLSPAGAAFISERTGIDVSVHPSTRGEKGAAFTTVPAIPCPPDLISCFLTPPETPVVRRRRFIRRESDEDSTYGTTWLSADACLGSANYDTLWVQRRPLIGYWRTVDDPAVVFRLRFRHDGKDFASARVHCAQEGPRVLTLIGLVTNQGDWHCSLDRPEEATFMAADFRARFELSGAGATSRVLGDERYELSAGGYRTVVQGGGGQFESSPVRWELGEDGCSVFADAVFYSGGEQVFRFSDITKAWAAAGVELIRADEPAGEIRLEAHPDRGNEVRVRWPIGAGLTIGAARRPTP